MAFVTSPLLPTTRTTRTAACNVSMAAEPQEPQEPTLSRRALLTGVIVAAAAAALPNNVLAEREYSNVGYLGGSGIIDINNANVRAYFKLRGFYPNLAGLIVANGPYKSVEDLYKLPGLTSAMKTALDENKDKLVALEPTPEYVIDRINNGLYR